MADLLPIMDPQYNLRELCKQLILLEDHLAQPRKRCLDCIRKHLLWAEALAEEAITLDVESTFAGVTEGLADTFRAIGRMVQDQEAEVPSYSWHNIAQVVRKVRKGLMPWCFNVRVARWLEACGDEPGTHEHPPGHDCGACPHRVATRYAKSFKLDVGMPILYGKYKNKKGIIKSFKSGPKGDPIVVVEQVPNDSGRKQDKELKLFKVRYDKARAQAMKKKAGTWGYAPWAGDAQHDDFGHVLDAVNPQPAYDKLWEHRRVVDSDTGYHWLSNLWGWVGILYLASESLHHLPADLVVEALASVRAMRLDPGFDNFISGWSEPDSLPKALDIIEKDLVGALRGVRKDGDHAGMVSLYKNNINDELEALSPRRGGDGITVLNASRIAAKYQKKKKVKKQDGDEMTVYEYSDGQIAHRNREKAKRVEKLRKNMGRLRRQVKGDLDAKDPNKRLAALAVALIDETYERVGNSGSAKEGHYGVTGWQVSHIKFSGGKATLSYVGKSGVKQTKTVMDAKVVKALKAATKGKPDSETILCEGDDCRITAKEVNEYLSSFDVTAKDIRGLHANEEMRSLLKKERKGTLPTDKKKRETQLKAEFKKALEGAAKAVGHEASTLKSQYLVPGLEDAFMKDGTVLSSLDKTSSPYIAPGNYTATRTARGGLRQMLDQAAEVQAIFPWGQQEGSEVSSALRDQLLGWAYNLAGQWYSIAVDAWRPVKARSERVAIRQLRSTRAVAAAYMAKTAGAFSDYAGTKIDRDYEYAAEQARQAGLTYDQWVSRAATRLRSKVAAYDIMRHCPHCQGITHDGPRYHDKCSDCDYRVAIAGFSWNDDPHGGKPVEKLPGAADWTLIAENDPRLVLRMQNRLAAGPGMWIQAARWSELVTEYTDYLTRVGAEVPTPGVAPAPRAPRKEAAGNQAIIEAPHNFHKVKLESPKAKRKQWPFEGYIDFQGIKIDVENAKGSTRSGTDPDGHPWSIKMHSHYGEIRGTEGTDGDKLDVYVGENHDSSIVVVIHQIEPSTGKFDEDKVMIGYDSVEEAIGAYKKQYDKPGFYRAGEHTEMPIGQFWRWVTESRNKGKKVKAHYDRSHPETLAWVEGFFSRHPALRKYSGFPVVHVGDPGRGRHPEASWTSKGIELYPKFRALSTGVADFVFAHEIGHAVLARWGGRNLMAAAKTAGVDPWDTASLPFAQGNYDEAFADSFASYHTDGDVKRRYPGWVQVVETAIQQVRTATKTRNEKEDEEADRLIRKKPKLKPPRTDLHRRRVEDQDEKDPDKEQDRKDQSHNWKDIGASSSSLRVAYQYLTAKGNSSDFKPPTQDVPPKHSPGEVWKGDKSWVGMNAKGETKGGHKSKEDAETWVGGGKGKKKDDKGKKKDKSDPEPSTGDDAAPTDTEEADPQAQTQETLDSQFASFQKGNPGSSLTQQDFEKAVKELVEDLVHAADRKDKKQALKALQEEIDKLESNASLKQMDSAFETLTEDKGLPEDLRADLEKRMSKMNPAEQKELAAAFTDTLNGLRENPPEGKNALEIARKAIGANLKAKVDTGEVNAKGKKITKPKHSNEEVGRLMAQALFAQRVTFNPYLLGDSVSNDAEPASNETKAEIEKAMTAKAELAYKTYSNFSEKERQTAVDSLAKGPPKREDLDPNSPRAMEVDALYRGVMFAAMMAGEKIPSMDVKGTPTATPGTQFTKLARAMKETGQETVLLGSLQDLQSVESQKAVRDALDTMTDSVFMEFLGEDHPLAGMGKALKARDAKGNFMVSEKQRKKIRKMLEDTFIEDIALLDPLVSDYMEANGVDPTPEARQEAINDITKEHTSKVMSRAKDLEDEEGNESIIEAMLAEINANLWVRATRANDWLAKKFEKEPENSTAHAKAKAIRDEEDPSILAVPFITEVDAGKRKEKPLTDSEKQERDKKRQKSRSKSKAKRKQQQKTKKKRRKKKGEDESIPGYDFEPWPEFSVGIQ